MEGPSRSAQRVCCPKKSSMMAVGHASPVDQPERVAEVVEGFLREREGATGGGRRAG